jgi:spore coat polysaccharide biosynthesis protein SpsF
MGGHKIVGAIQARISSTRLARKVMKRILGYPMLWHIFKRIEQACSIDKVVIATSTNAGDEEIVTFARNHGIDYYRGSEDDIVDRMYQTACKFEATGLVRVTADCPVVDPKVIDEVVGYFVEDTCDYVSNWGPYKRTYPHGLEVEIYSRDCLQRLWQDVKEPLMREWLPFNIHNNPDKFHMRIVENEVDLSDFRWTVDYEEDFVLVSKIYRELYKENVIFTMEDILRFIRKNPELSKINEKFKEQKGIEDYLEQKSDGQDRRRPSGTNKE